MQTNLIFKFSELTYKTSTVLAFKISNIFIFLIIQQFIDILKVKKFMFCKLILKI